MTKPRKKRAPAEKSPTLDSPKRFLNRELSWLAFNTRVLEEAENPNHPLLERLRFLLISASNLDEFYMVRVAGLRGQERAHVNVISADGLTPIQQLAAINQRSGELMRTQQAHWRNLRDELRENGISVVEPSEVTGTEMEWLDNHFMDQIFPVLTPMAVDPAHPFPFIPNKGIGVVLELDRGKGELLFGSLSKRGIVGRRRCARLSHLTLPPWASNRATCNPRVSSRADGSPRPGTPRPETLPLSTPI